MQRYIPNYKIQLVKESNYISDRKIIRSPYDCFEIMREIYESYITEHFNIIMLSTKNHVLGISTISIGSLNASIVHPREVFTTVLLQGKCAGIILCHNHPSGDPTPSHEDISLTKKLVDAGKILEINVLDHIIIGEEKYVSLKERGII